jgi:hypothetical protein
MCHLSLADGRHAAEWKKRMTQIDKEAVERLAKACEGTMWIEANTLRALCAALDAAEAEKQQMERENQLQAEEIDKTRRRADKWQSMVLDCEKYLKPGETPYRDHCAAAIRQETNDD